MKLEVGQKIGIYEVVRNLIRNELVYPIGSCHLGYKSKHNTIDLYDPFDSSNGFEYDYSEVRKVGNLIVKKLK